LVIGGCSDTPTLGGAEVLSRERYDYTAQFL